MRSRINQKGAALVLIALSLVVILGVLGLLVDSIIGEDTQHQCIMVSEQVAQGALNEYLKTVEQLSSEDLDQQFYQVLSRIGSYANALVARNSVVGGSPGNTLGDLGFTFLGCSDPQLCNNSPNGFIQPGIWLTTDPGPVPRTCGTLPCFEEFDINNANHRKEFINAFRVETRLPGPVRTYFIKVLNIPGLMVRGRATARVSERHVAFLVDVSPSVVGESFKLSNPPCDGTGIFPNCPADFAGSFIYNQLSPDSIRLATTASRFSYKTHMTCSGLWQPEDAENPNHQCAHLNSRCSWCGLENNISSWGGSWGLEPYAAAKHFKSDYAVKQLHSYDLNGIASTENLILNKRIIDAKEGAEPLFSILRGINRSMQVFKERRIAGDRAGVLAFDQTVFPDSQTENIRSRTFPLTSNFDLLMGYTDVDLNNVWGDQNSYIAKFLFPRPRANTYGYGALSRALDWLRSARRSGVEDQQIVLFTDGLFNCLTESNCSTLDDNFLNTAYEDILSDLVPQMASLGIRVNILQFGESVAPHFAQIRDRSDNRNLTCPYDGRGDVCGRCMKEEEISNLGLWGIVGNLHHTHIEYANAASGFGTYTPVSEKLWQLARMTGGRYYPIRPQDPNYNAEPLCSITYPQSCLDNPNVPCNFLADHRAECPPGRRCGCSTDSNCLIRFDPQNRTMLQQVTDSLSNILGPVPITLVE